MNNDSRERILGHLQAAIQRGGFVTPETPALPTLEWNQEEKINRLKTLLENMHAEVYRTSRAEWLETLKTVLRSRPLKGLLYAPDAPWGERLAVNWESDLPALIPYDQTVETFKEKLFEMDASITSTRGAVAETGALILWPHHQEPRLMSLVPGVHIAIVEAGKIYNTFTEAMTVERWQDGMPTNALLISGPSKTADIELVLTFGVHGPKALVVIILED